MSPALGLAAFAGLRVSANKAWDIEELVDRTELARRAGQAKIDAREDVGLQSTD
jgi:hypothetical protein